MGVLAAERLINPRQTSEKLERNLLKQTVFSKTEKVGPLGLAAMCSALDMIDKVYRTEEFGADRGVPAALPADL